MSRLIRVFTVLFVNLFSIPLFEIRNKQGRCPNLAVCPNIPDLPYLHSIYIYRKRKWMFFLADFCYVVNILTIVILW